MNNPKTVPEKLEFRGTAAQLAEAGDYMILLNYVRSVRRARIMGPLVTIFLALAVMVQNHNRTGQLQQLRTFGIAGLVGVHHHHHRIFIYDLFCPAAVYKHIMLILAAFLKACHKRADGRF